MLLDRSPKYLAISRDIEALIRTGRWKDGAALSARRIAEEHGVSVVTASRALQVLRDRGLIQTVERLGSYLAPAAPVAATGEKWAVCFRVTPGPWYQASLSTTRSGFQEMARRQGVVLDTETFEDGSRATVAELRRRAQRGVAAGVGGVFFLPSRLSVESAQADEATLDACRASGLPVVLIERNLRGRGRPLEYDLVGTDDVDGGFRCTRHLLEQGRRRVAFVMGSPTSSHEGRLAGYLCALFQATSAEGLASEPLVFEQPSEVPSKAAYQQLADRILADRVDGVVCFQDYTAIGLILELLTRGVQVPQDVALTGFDDLPIGDSFALGVTTYAPPAEAVAEEALNVMRRRVANPAAPPVKVLVPGRLIVRESSRFAPEAPVD
ncbi:MAG: substrate-binding domain-containing protein [Isosphaeraceae bacterium]|nr:substrate-binding domain-containing protein [Isosphaeraceae bacterium]